MLTGKNLSLNQQVLSGDDGQFSFANVAPGPFQLTITSAGFATQTSSGILLAGEIHTVPQIVLPISASITEVQVSLSPAEVAQAQMKDEEKQRVFGVIPNFYVTYDPHPLPLTAKEKYELSLEDDRGSGDLRNHWGHCRSAAGAEHFQRIRARRARLCEALRRRLRRRCVGTFIGSAILPSLLKQDPRYFYKGTGSKPLANSVRHRKFGDLQGRQRTLAAELLEPARKPRRWRHFKSVLSGAKS